MNINLDLQKYMKDLNKNRISTEIDTKTLIFTIVAFIVSVIVSLILFIKYASNGLAIFAGIMFAVVAIACAVVLFGMFSDKAYIEDDVLYMSYLFKRSSIKLSEVNYIKFKDDVYHIYNNKNEEVGTINGLALGIDAILNKFYETKIKVL